MVWFRVGCCERCGGVGSRGERGSGIASIIPKMRMMRGSGGTIPLGGGGGGYVAQGLVHIYVSVHYDNVPQGTTPKHLFPPSKPCMFASERLFSETNLGLCA